MTSQLSRRDLLAGAGGAIALAAGGLTWAKEAAAAGGAEPEFKFCLNTSTIRGQKLSIAEEVDIAAKAGYDAIEPWLRELDEYVKSGHSLSELNKRIQDAGLTVESAIGFAEWIVDDPDRRAKGLEQAKRDMDALQQIGGRRMAAPPAGATDQANLNLFEAAKRYAELSRLGEQMGITPQVEVWGFSKCLSRLGETAFVAIESGHAQACILPDVYHVYKGGSDFAGLKLLSGAAVHVLHMNDFPKEPSREQITDAHRVYPGDGVAPLDAILRDMRAAGFAGVFSLELFNPDYWAQDAYQVAKTGLEKMKTAVQKALA